MDSVSPGSRREVLHDKVEAAQTALRRAASAAVIQGDPLSEQLRAVAMSIGALADIYDASEDTQLEIADTLKTQSEKITQESLARVHASGVAIIDQLAPRLAGVVEKTTRDRLQTLRLRTLASFSGIALGVVLVVGGFAYAAGLNAGRTQGEVTAQTINAAMAFGPGAAAAWSSLMANNDPVHALAACQKNASTTAEGRRYCELPVWLDSPPAPAS